MLPADVASSAHAFISADLSGRWTPRLRRWSRTRVRVAAARAHGDRLLQLSDLQRDVTLESRPVRSSVPLSTEKPGRIAWSEYAPGGSPTNSK